MKFREDFTITEKVPTRNLREPSFEALPGPRPVEAVLRPREVLGLAREAEVVISKVLQGFVRLLMTH